MIMARLLSPYDFGVAAASGLDLFGSPGDGREERPVPVGEAGQAVLPQ
jgi:hypothetical protein